MTSIPDDLLFNHADRVKDKVVLITGAAAGIGKETALRFASHGAKLVIGDINAEGAQKTVSEIANNGGTATSLRCDVTQWDQLVTLFEHAIKTYGAVDVVVVNAGVGEIGQFGMVKFASGQPLKPDLTTLDVNLIGLAYTTHLATHYLPLNHQGNSLKAIVLLGSIASWMGIPGGAMYTAAKHGALGIMRSLYPTLALRDIRISIIHPFFADTAIVPLPVKVFLAGIPLTPVARIAGAIFYSATNPDPETNGCAWLLPDDGPVFLVPREEFKMGVYKMIDERTNSLLKGARGVLYVARVFRDLYRTLGRPVLIISIIAVLAFWAKKRIL